jgi:outer membrane usher protein
VYRVDVYVNDQYAFTRDINLLRVPAQDSTGLLPCLDIKTLKGLVSILPNMKACDTTQQCVDFTSIIEGATTQFHFDKQKLNISLPQISLMNQVRGYISPDQWDEGINGLFLNYNISGYNNSKTDSNSAFLRLDNGLNIGGMAI